MERPANGEGDARDAKSKVEVTAPAVPSVLSQTLGVAHQALTSVRVLMSSGLHRTSAGDLSAKIFEKNSPALRAYLTIALRNVELSRRAFVAVHDELQYARVADIKKAPSRIAHIYLLARNMSEYSRLFDDDFQERSIDSVPWEPAPAGSHPDYGKALDHLRHTLSDEEFEMLQLHVVRGLPPRGVGHVLGLREEDAERKLKAASAWADMNARQVCEDFASVDVCIQDACRVLPPPPDEEPVVLTVPEPLPVGTVVSDRYTIEGKVGGGAFGWVYRAVDVNVPGHVVALKLLHKAALNPAARDGAIRELSVIASAFHPSLVQFKDHGWFEERLWFVMPWYQGETLEARADRDPLSLEEAASVFEPIARALASIHHAGIRHQDIKPDNIFLAEVETGIGSGMLDALPVLMDLGVAAPEGDMAVAGTPMYFAPEVAARFCDAESGLPVTDRADVFALALSLAHAVEPPDAESLRGLDFETFVQERREEVPEYGSESKLSPIAPSLARWLSKDSTERPSALELADELAAIRTGVKPGRRFRKPRRGGSPTVGRLKARSGMVLSLALIIGALVGWWAQSQWGDPNIDGAGTAQFEIRINTLESRLDQAETRAEALEGELGELRSGVLFGDTEDQNSAVPAGDPEETED